MKILRILGLAVAAGLEAISNVILIPQAREKNL
jgi:hypothetical protein